jgi:Fe-S oxidoreductase
VKAVLGIHPDRTLPQFSSKQYKERPAQNGGKPVLLWRDTWNNYFHPEALAAASIVLGQAGYQVQPHQRHVCCGRPLYDFGFLDEARKYLRRILDTFAREIDAGIPVVMLEPSCASVFRDELVNFFPKDERATRLSQQTIMLGELLMQESGSWQPPRLGETKILVQGHCHQKALMSMKDDMALLESTGATVELLDSGCCGMAGPFGFERGKFAVSQALAERVLLPAIRAAHESTILVSNGFSCREQIRQNSPRRAVHLAEVLAGNHVQSTRGTSA